MLRRKFLQSIAGAVAAVATPVVAVKALSKPVATPKALAAVASPVVMPLDEWLARAESPDRTLQPLAQSSCDEMRAWSMDIRQILSDNSIKDMLAQEDEKFLAAVRTTVGLAEPDSPAAVSIPFATLPVNTYIRGPRYFVSFDHGSCLASKEV